MSGEGGQQVNTIPVVLLWGESKGQDNMDGRCPLVSRQARDTDEMGSTIKIL